MVLVINVFNELCDRERPCDSKFVAKQTKKTKKRAESVSGQICEMYHKGQTFQPGIRKAFNLSRTTTLQNSVVIKSCRNTISNPQPSSYSHLRQFD